MVTEDQREVVAFLASPATHGGAPVEQLETHASIVFLAGSRAWKLKRAVRYDYLDFSTPDRRRAMCEAEVRVNRRTAAELYRGVAAVTREADGSLALNGAGTPVDWLVEMNRFDQEQLLDRLAARGVLAEDLMPPLAETIASLHRGAEVTPAHGGRAGIAWVVDGNADGFAREGAATLDQAECAALTGASRAALDRCGAQLDRRRLEGRVRRCHGDLHLRNIVLIDGRPTLFDGIEFNDAIACIDVLYDLAFLLMDLWRRGLPRHANRVCTEYLAGTGDFSGVSVMPLLLSCRAAVRAKTSATAAALQSDPQRADGLQALARGYLRMAGELLRPPQPCLIAIGGYSGSGKTTLARALAPRIGPVPGAVVIRSDEIRKRLLGVPALTRLGPEGYASDVTRDVYRIVAERTGLVLRGGHAAIVDAVYARLSDREAIERAAASAGAPFAGLWLDAAADVLVERVGRRQLDASDADASVVRAQQAEGCGALRWERVPASGAPEQVLDRAVDVLERRTGAFAG